ncbi:MAG: hypothetical protein WBE68_17155, partial [Candidatus Nitrosopolaris sp.]
SKLPYLVCSSYRYASVNVSADDAYTPTVRGFLSAIFTDRDHTRCLTCMDWLISMIGSEAQCVTVMLD